MRLKEFDVKKEGKKLDRRYSNKQRLIFSGIVLLLLTILLYTSYAIFIASDRDNITNTEVGPFSTGDVKLAIMVDEVKQDNFPTKESGKRFDKVECNNSGEASWDKVNWKLSIKNVSDKTSCNVYFKTSTTKTVISGEIRVDYDENMIPISYDASTGATLKADITNTDATYKWYDYSTFKWANAVLVTDATRTTHKNSTPGTSIPEADILAYVVYVPRYRYELFNTYNEGKPVQDINVVFENIDTPKSKGVSNGQWLTHPAFTFGDTELNGIWVGKFQATGTATNPTVKPNVNSFCRNLSDMFTTSLRFKSESRYGINNSSIDSHMMKNMEWGAVAYLSQSQYGKRGTGSFIGDSQKDIYK